MPLAEIELSDRRNPLPEPVLRLLAAADAAVREHSRGLEGRTPLIPCDHEAIYRALAEIRRRGLSDGSRFLEWGAGLAVVAGLASLLGFDAAAIEIDAPLHEASLRFLDQEGLQVEVARGSFIPRELEALADRVEEPSLLQLGGASAYDDLGSDPSDFDLVYVYPWPGEEEVVPALFEACAAPGALLLTYHSDGSIRLRRSGRGAGSSPAERSP